MNSRTIVLLALTCTLVACGKNDDPNTPAVPAKSSTANPDAPAFDNAANTDASPVNPQVSSPADSAPSNPANIQAITPTQPAPPPPENQTESASQLPPSSQFVADNTPPAPEAAPLPQPQEASPPPTAVPAPTSLPEAAVPVPVPVQAPVPIPRPRPAQASATARMTDLEAELLSMINKSRAKAGVAPLKFSPLQSKGSTKCVGSVGHSMHMGATRTMSHDQFPSDICVKNSMSGENVGYAEGDQSQALGEIHKMMMDEGPSGGHYQNIMSGTYNRVGLGLYYVHGTLWLTEDFVRE